MTDDSLDDVCKAKLKDVDIGKMVGSTQSVYGREIWNAAIEAAVKAVFKAPVFPKGNYGGPKANAERLLCLSAVEAEIRKLKK